MKSVSYTHLDVYKRQVPVLVLTKAIDKKYQQDNIYICSPNKLERLIISKLSNKQFIDIENWLKGCLLYTSNTGGL